MNGQPDMVAKCAPKYFQVKRFCLNSSAKNHEPESAGLTRSGINGEAVIRRGRKKFLPTKANQYNHRINV